MKANELMIGDWVRIKLHQRNTQVINIGSGYLSTKAEFPLFENEVEPIPLTAEILEKNGFVKSRIGKGWLQWNQKQGGLVDIFIDNKGISGMPMAVTFGHNVVNMHAHYVHELQHALRLCGIEKQITI